MTLEPHPFPDPSEASKKSSLLPTSLLLLLKKDDVMDTVLSMNMDRPNASWKHLLAPTKKNSRVKPVEELEMREGTGLMRGAESPCLEFGGGTGIGEA